MATAVTIQILVESDQAQAAVTAFQGNLQQAGVAGAASFEKVGAASTEAASKIKSAVTPASAFEQQMRQLGMSGASAALGIDKVVKSSTDATTRMRTANGEMQQMVANMEAAHTKLAAIKLPPPPAARPSSPLGEAFSRFNSPQAEADALGNAFARMGGGIKPADEAIKSLTGHTATGLDAVRLLSQEFGLRLPRAIEAMLARMPAVVGALGSMLGAMAAIAAAQVFVVIAQDGYRLYEQYVSLNAEADKFYETLKKTAQEDFSNTRSLETTNLRLGSAQRTYEAGNSAAQAGQNSAFVSLAQGDIAGGIGSLMGAHKNAEQSAQAAASIVSLQKGGNDQTHAQALAQIELNHAMDATLNNAQKINAETAKKKQINAENTAYDRKIEMSLSNAAPSNAGTAAQQLKDRQADAEANAQKVILNREASFAIMKANDETSQASLQGNALYLAKYTQGSAEIVQQLHNQGKYGQQVAAEVAAFHAKLNAEEMNRTRALDEETRKMAQAAMRVGLEGTAAIATDLKAKLADIEKARSKASGTAALTPAQSADFDSQRDSANRESMALRRKLDEDYTDFVQSQVATRTEAELKGFARIDATAAKLHDEAQRRYDKQFVQTGANGARVDNGSDRNHADFAAQSASIDREAGVQRIRLTQDINLQTLQMDRDAAQADRRMRADGLLGWVQDYRSAATEIQSAHDALRARIDKEQSDNVGDRANNPAMFDQYEKQKVDADRIANAQIAAQNLDLQHQIAGTLQQAFNNPVEAIKSAMEKMFFEIVASWIMRMDAFKAVFGNTMGNLQPGNSTGGFMGKILSGTGGAFGGHPSVAGQYGSMTSTNDAAGAVSMGARPFAGSASSSASSGFGSVMSTANQVTSLGGLINPPPVSGMGGVFQGKPSVSTTGISIPDWNDPTGPEQQASAQTQDALSGAGASGMASQALGIAGAGMGAYTGFQSTVDAFKSGSALKGALGDAAAGAAIGSLAGPVGTVIGAGVGAAIGATAGLLGMVTGEGGKLSARDYYQKNVLPTFQQDEAHPEYTDFQSAISDANRTAGSALAYMRIHFGSDAADWVNDQYMKKELTKITSMYANSAKGGRQFTTLSASQFHTGGTVAGFGSFGTSSNEGFIHAMLGETVMNTQASDSHAPMLRAMNSGVSAADIAGAYLAAAAPSSPTAASGSDVHHHYHIDTLDTKTMSTWLRTGGARMITKHQNDQTALYAGDGNNG